MIAAQPTSIVITPGEPAGIGPDITIQIAQQSWPCQLTVVADPDLLLQRAKQLGLPLRLNTSGQCETHQPGTLNIIPVSLNVPADPGVLNPANASYVLQTLVIAAELCNKKMANAIVTGPVHKGVINQANIPFTGHTEFFAHACKVEHTVMLFVVDELKVALATTHIPLAKVPHAITRERLLLVISILNSELKQKFHIQAPRILVCGLNPHAGEGGYLGREEIEVIAPTLRELQEQHYIINGPLPADTIFTPQNLKQADVVLAMYHDQALPVVKYAGFGHAVNVTLGLPFIRTSVDHGTAIGIAGSGGADAGSMCAALELAIKMCQSGK
jgi:4-hydroxythreonine-4-phosphate dehydrogenase